MNRWLKIAIISCLYFAGMSTLGYKVEHQKWQGRIASIGMPLEYSIENEMDASFDWAILRNINISLNEAARRNSRYRERLTGFVFFSDADIKKENSPNNCTSKKSLFTLPLNNHCLSSCYDYIFLFTLF